MKHILILDDDKTTCLMLKSWFVKEGYYVEIATNVEDAQKIVKKYAVDLILSDIRMPGVDGFSFLSWVKRYDSAIMVMMMTGFSDVSTAVEAIKSGAVDYVEKPIKAEMLFEKVSNAFKNYANTYSERDPNKCFLQPHSKEYEVLMQKVDATIENQKHILISGARGTGKSSLRKYIHKKIAPQNGAIVVIDKIEHAEDDYLKTQFKAAQNGILCVKTFHKLSKKHQNELTELLTNQSHEDYTQVIATSSLPIAEVRKYILPKLFYYFRDNCVELPTLEGKKDDILFFMSRFLKFANYELGKNIDSFSPELQKIFVQHEWKGNVQELKNTIIKAVLSCDSNVITTDILSDLGGSFLNLDTSDRQTSRRLRNLKKENYERQKIKEALEISNGNKTLAASILNIDRKTLYNKIRLYNVETI